MILIEHIFVIFHTGHASSHWTLYQQSRAPEGNLFYIKNLEICVSLYTSAERQRAFQHIITKFLLYQMKYSWQIYDQSEQFHLKIFYNIKSTCSVPCIKMGPPTEIKAPSVVKSTQNTLLNEDLPQASHPTENISPNRIESRVMQFAKNCNL